MKKSRLFLALLSSILAVAGCNNKEGEHNSTPPVIEEFDYAAAPEGAVTTMGEKFVLKNGSSYLAFSKNEDNKFGIELYDTASNKLISYNKTPIMLRVRGKDTGLLASYKEVSYNGAYSTIDQKTYGYLCKGTLKTENNSEFEFTDNYYISYTQGITMDRVVKVITANEKDVGFASLFSLINAKNKNSYEDFEYFIPGILYKNSSNMPSSAIASSLDTSRIYVKETRGGVPMAMMRDIDEGSFTSLSHVEPKISANGLVGGGAAGEYDNRIQYGSFGYTMTKVSVDFCYPCHEGPVTYDAGASWARRYHPVTQDNAHTYKLSIYGKFNDTFNDALVDSFEVGYCNLKSKIIDEFDNRTAYEQAIVAFNSEYREFGTGAIKSAGLPWELKLETSQIAREYSFQFGFVGMQSSVGANLYHEGLFANNAGLKRKGETILNFWASNSINDEYFPNVWWDANNNNAAGGQRRSYACYLRCMVDGMEGLLDAYNFSLDYGEPRQDWLDVVKRFADNLVAKQNNDGSFYRAYNKNGTVAINPSDRVLQGDSKLNTPIAIKFLAKMYELTRNEAYKNAVIKAADFTYTELYEKLGKYVGGTPDNPNVVDKEAAIYAFYAGVYAYKIKQDERYKKFMIHASCCALSWTFMYDYACPSGDSSATNPFVEEGHMIGFSVIATGHGAADNFSSFIWYELYRVFELTGIEYFKEAAILLQHNCKGSTDYNGDFGYLYNAMCPEATRVSDFSFIGVKVWLPWCSIANIQPIINLYHDHQVWQIEDIQSK